MEGKKISFGFMKTKKAEKPVVEEKKDLIECVEEKSIKVVGGDEIKEDSPLIIPMKPNTLVTAERLKQIAEEVEKDLAEPEIVEKPDLPLGKPSENESLEQMAVRELLNNARKEDKVETPVFTVPLPAKPVNEGEKESTLDDYESVPVQDFGLAMLRGMGWAPGKENSLYKQPQLRPKGLGLGADKVVKSNQKQKTAKDSKGEDLTIVKNAYVKINTGKYSGYYGKVVSLDDDNGRVMVDIAVKKETASLSEFMMHPVTKSEFDKESKVINAGSYEEYKKKESITSSKIEEERSNKYSDKEATSSKRSDRKYDQEEKSRNSEDYKSSKNGKDYKEEERRVRDRDRSQRSRRDSTEERSSQRKYKRYSSNESLRSISETENKRSKKSPESEKDKKKKSKKERKRYSSSGSESSDHKKSKKKDKKSYDSSDSESDHKSRRNKTLEGKRDIDKKRKGKKKKRDRDRSPNYRKHRK